MESAAFFPAIVYFAESDVQEIVFIFRLVCRIAGVGLMCGGPFGKQTS